MKAAELYFDVTLFDFDYLSKESFEFNHGLLKSDRFKICLSLSYSLGVAKRAAAVPLEFPSRYDQTVHGLHGRKAEGLRRT